MNKLEVKYLKVEEIKPYKDNPRKNEGAVDVVASSIKEFGFQNPIILDKNNEIIAGHTRLLAANKLSLKEVPVIWAKDLTEEQVKAFRIMDNKSAEFADWDANLLKGEFGKLEGFDFDLTGFDKEMRELIGVVEDFDKLLDVDLEGDSVDLHDVIIVQLKNTAHARKIRKFLKIGEKKKSVKSEDFIKVIP